MATNSNIWLGGFWTGGTLNGVEWSRGEWHGGEWQRGNWYSNDLNQNYDDEDENKNQWSKWKGGIWKSNSQNYSSNALEQLNSEWSVWHGGVWSCEKIAGREYTWQGTGASGRNVWGQFREFNCGGTDARIMLLPANQGMWLGGQWLRGEWHGGIFANGVWHSLENTNQDLTVNPSLSSSLYNPTASIFTKGAFLQSIWEGGTVEPTEADPFHIMFGMAYTSNFFRRLDDSGFYNDTGFLESQELIYKRYFGTRLLNWQQYFDNAEVNNAQDMNRILKWRIDGDKSFFFPKNQNKGGVYSAIWKRGHFKGGVFSWGQWFDVDLNNNLKMSYNQDDWQNPNDLDNYNSVFHKGLFYNSLWYNGIAQAQNHAEIQKRTVFSRSIWLTGLWLAQGKQDASTDNYAVTNAKFWKSVWLSGRWQGGAMQLSSWLSLNPFDQNLVLDGVEITPSTPVPQRRFLNNWLNNPLGQKPDISYYQPDTDQYTTVFENLRFDFNRTDILNEHLSDQIDVADLARDSSFFYIEFDANDEPTTPDPNTEYEGIAYDFYLENPSEEIPHIEDEIEGDHFFEPEPPSGWNISLYNDSAFYTNPDTENERFIRFMGLVDNAASVWTNGEFEGSTWHGGIWSRGIFKPFTTDQYPKNITNPNDPNNQVKIELDWFDDDIISRSRINKIQKSVWNRGLWLSGYFHQYCLFFAIPAYQANTELILDLNNRLALSQADMQNNFNVLTSSGSKLLLRPVNEASMFSRKALRSNQLYYTSLFNGHFMSGLFYDKVRTNFAQSAEAVPILGTRTFSEDNIAARDVPTPNWGPYLNFGGMAYYYGTDTLVEYSSDIAGDYYQINFNLKVAANSNPIQINPARPVLYDPNLEVTSISGDQIIGGYNYPTFTDAELAFFLRWLPGFAHLQKDIRHAHRLPGEEQPPWSDIDLVDENYPEVPSFAQGTGRTPEPYYTKPPTSPNWPC